MKVDIGKYPTWVGPYQIADVLLHFGVSEDRCHTIGDWIANTWIEGFLTSLYAKRKRKIKVVIDEYDVWNMDRTLAYIILPMLLILKKQKRSSSYVKDEDVPEELKLKIKEIDSIYDNNYVKRWEWVIDEMIWGFEQSDLDWEDGYINKENERCDFKGIKLHQARIDNALILFGKYYQGLWT